jgi:hypothetical protein
MTLATLEIDHENCHLLAHAVQQTPATRTESFLLPPSRLRQTKNQSLVPQSARQFMLVLTEGKTCSMGCEVGQY